MRFFIVISRCVLAAIWAVKSCLMTKAVLHTLLALLLFPSGLMAQSPGTQTIRGQVIDADLQMGLPGATVILVQPEGAEMIGTTTDGSGYYRLENVPLGRQTIQISFIGYADRTIPNIVVSSAKEVIMNVEMEESSVAMKEVEITATGKKGEVLNEMTSVSARAFTVEETERYAGSRGDPARMASNFAGVQGSDDTRNDIVVRGNSPLGVMYRVEGVQIPNPNHFAIAGSTGGPVGILNNKVLSNSDFFTGAFPAEFGNSTAGVFDIRLRNGNNEKHEFTGQFGMFGTELLAEGPISKEKRSSYLITGRYATTEIFGILGIDIGTDAIPRYQDMSFKLNFPTKNNGNLAVWGIGGRSKIDIIISDQVVPEVDLYGENDRDQYFSTRMGVAGITYTKSINTKTYLKATLAAATERQTTDHDFIIRHLGPDSTFVVDSIYQLLGYRFDIHRQSGSVFINRKVNSQHLLRFGVVADVFQFNMLDTVLDPSHTEFITRWDYQGTSYMAQPFVQWRYKMTESLTLNAGVHSQYFSLSNSLSAFEPRIGLKYEINDKQTINAGFGVHSQIQPLYTYLYHQEDVNGNRVYHNINMDFSKSNHYVLGYDNAFADNMRLKVETYYQQLYNIPVEMDSSSFSLINQGSGFARFFPDSLQNTGTGTNYGVEVTLEKFFSRQYFFMITASFYESKYAGSDGIERNTDYNGNYVINGLFGKEFKLGEKGTLLLGTKVTAAGGNRYGLVDVPASQALNELIFLDSMYNEFQFRDYFRWDLKVNWRHNAEKVTHEFGLDFVNVLGTQNILNLTYFPDAGDPDRPFRENYQLGRLPIFFYRIDF